MPHLASPSCDSLELGATDTDLVDLQKDIKRCIVNRELMMLYGQDTTGYLPPLPKQDRPKSSSAPAWSCGNPAVRQLANISRRGPRLHLAGRSSGAAARSLPAHPLSASSSSLCLSLPTRPSTAMSEVDTRRRPHTAYTSFIKSILNRKVADVSRPSTAESMIDSMTPRRNNDADLDRVIFPSQMALRADDVMNGDDFPDFNPVDTNVSGRLKSPRMMRNNNRRKKREKKKKVASVDAKRNADVLKVLKGDLETVPPEPSTVVRVYLCANSMDMEVERKALRCKVYPELRDFCRRLGLDFHIVDMHEGADLSTDQDYVTSGVYVREVASCQELSTGPSFLMILGDKYGVAPLPPQIDADEFEIMRKMAEEERLPKHFLMDEWYLKDENTIPPVYVLQSRPVEVKNRRGRRRKDQQIPYTDKRMREKFYAQLQQLLQEAISVSMEEGKLIYQERKHKYFKSSMEDVVLEGVIHCKNTADQCLCYIREFSDLPRNVYNEVSRKYADMLVRDGQAKPDAQARKFLQQVKSNINNKLEETNNLRNYEPSLTEYVLGEEDPSAENPSYISQLTADIVADMKGLIERGKELLDAATSSKHYEMYRQVLPHAARVKEVTEGFIGRDDLFEAVQGYLKDGEKCQKPLIIHGPAGYGKTSFMGMLAKHAKKWFGSTSVVVLRFISETLQTANIMDVLHSICTQLCVVYGIEAVPKDSTRSIYRMAAVFNAYLEQVSKHHGEKKPLVILLDGLDQMNEKHRSHAVHWLPAVCPPHVYMVASVESSCAELKKCLHMKLSSPDCFMDLGEVTAETVETMVEAALTRANRLLQPQQKDFLLRNCKANPHPIYLALTIKEALTWCSYTMIDEDHVPTTAEDAISRVLDRLETKYGMKLVQDTVSYLVVAQTGLTETELTDALSCNDEVLQDVFIQHDLPLDDVVVMPSFLIASLLDDLKVLLCRRNKDNKTVLAWRNRTYRELCCKKYYGVIDLLDTQNEEAQHYCHDLAEIFLQDAGIRKQFEHPMTYTVIENTDRQVNPQVLSKENLRKLKLLPWFISQSGRTTEALGDLTTNCVCNFNWLLTKLHALGVGSVMDDLLLLDLRDNDLLLMRDIVRLARPGLQEDPDSLAAHLLGMVPDVNSQQGYSAVAEVVSDAKRWIELTTLPLIVPVMACLPSPFNMCKQKYWGITEVLTLDSMGQLAVVKSKDNTIEFWDMVCGELVESTGIRYDRIDPNVYCSDQTVAIYSSCKLFVWDILTCMVAQTVDLTKLLGESLSTTLHMYHSQDFKLIILQSSDDDFNQTVSVLDTDGHQVLHNIPDFDVKDEFYRNSAILMEDEQTLVFVNARSESKEDGTNQDNVKLNIYNLEQGDYVHQINVGHKKFHQILLHKDLIILCWTNASFDIYSSSSGEKVSDIPAPDESLALKSCQLGAQSNALFFLASTVKDSSSMCYSALWSWNIEEQQLSQFLTKRHRSGDEVFEHFLIQQEENFAVLTAPDVAKVWLWDIQGHKPIQSINAHLNQVTSLHPLTSDPYVFFSGSAPEGVIKRWDVYQAVIAGLSSNASFRSRRPSTPGDGILKRQGSSEEDFAGHKLGSAKSGKSVRFAEGYGDDWSPGSSRPGTAGFGDDLSAFATLSPTVTGPSTSSPAPTPGSSSTPIPTNPSPATGPGAITLIPSSAGPIAPIPNSPNALHSPIAPHSPIALSTPHSIAALSPSAAPAGLTTAAIPSMPGSSPSSPGLGTPPPSPAVLSRSPAPDSLPASPSPILPRRSPPTAAMLNVCCASHSRLGHLILTGYEKSLPTLWDARSGHVVLKMAPQTASDYGTPWVAFGSRDRFVVGLTNTEKAAKGMPQSYMFQMWSTETGQPIRLPNDLYATAGTLTFDQEKVLLVSLDSLDPGQGNPHDVVFRLVNLGEQQVVHSITYNTTVIPTSIQLTEDDKCAVTNNESPARSPEQDVAMFTIETSEEDPQVCFYEFMKGKKYPEYRVTRNYVMKNGLSLAVGVHGDMQIWDIPSCEYEENLCEDPSVKDKCNPNLHTHGGYAINTVAVSVDGRFVLCASEDSTASLWDMDNATILHRYGGHVGQVTAVAITEDNQLVLTAGEDELLNVWYFGEMSAPIARLRIYTTVFDLQITPDKHIVHAIGRNRSEPDRLLIFRLKNVKDLSSEEQQQQQQQQQQAVS